MGGGPDHGLRPGAGLPQPLRTQLVVALDPASRIRSGTKAELWFDPERMPVFDAATGDNLTRDPDRTFDDDNLHAGVRTE